MIEVENTDVNIVRNLIPMRNHMPASAYGLKAISDWFFSRFSIKNSVKSTYLSTIDFTNFLQNSENYGNLLYSHTLLEKKFVKATFLQKKLLNSWFHEKNC